MNLAMMDIYEVGGVFRRCKCHHEMESRMIRVKEKMLEAHLEVKNQLIRNLEDIIDEQEARIRNMDDYITGMLPFIPFFDYWNLLNSLRWNILIKAF